MAGVEGRRGCFLGNPAPEPGEQQAERVCRLRALGSVSVFIGIDPGSAKNCGFAVLTASGMHAMTMDAHGPAGLADLRRGIVDVLDGPGSCVVFEHPYFQVGKSSAAAALFRIVGVVEEAAFSCGAVSVGCEPMKLKAHWGINPKAIRRQVVEEFPGRTKSWIDNRSRLSAKQAMIECMRSMGHDPGDEHQADAMALVEWLCHGGRP